MEAKYKIENSTPVLTKCPISTVDDVDDDIIILQNFEEAFIDNEQSSMAILETKSVNDLTKREDIENECYGLLIQIRAVIGKDSLLTTSKTLGEKHNELAEILNKHASLKELNTVFTEITELLNKAPSSDRFAPLNPSATFNPDLEENFAGESLGMIQNIIIGPFENLKKEFSRLPESTTSQLSTLLIKINQLRNDSFFPFAPETIKRDINALYTKVTTSLANVNDQTFNALMTESIRVREAINKSGVSQTDALRERAENLIEKMDSFEKQTRFSEKQRKLFSSHKEEIINLKLTFDIINFIKKKSEHN